jgi:hypothetical protein
MSAIKGLKYAGSVIVNLTNVQDKLVDIPPGGLKGARKEKEDIDGVIAELAASIPNHGDDADIPYKAHQRFVERTDLLAELRTHETALEKLLEVCRETRGKTENDREDDIGIMARAVQNAAKKNPSILAPFEKTVAYNGQIGDKAAATRRKNEAADAQAAEEAAAKDAAAKDTAAKDTAAKDAAAKDTAAKMGDGQTPPA